MCNSTVVQVLHSIKEQEDEVGCLVFIKLHLCTDIFEQSTVRKAATKKIDICSVKSLLNFKTERYALVHAKSTTETVQSQ